ncbi:MAG: single-stranded-DNA-specific exonuclease RecJ [Anaerolineaceae bacterium]
MKQLFTPQWIDPKPVTIPNELRKAIVGSDLLLSTLVQRGYTDPQKALAFLDPSLYVPASPLELPDLGKAVQRIRLNLSKNEMVGVWGDFDVDGQTSTTVLVSALRHLGANVVYHIPIRKTESHGILLDPLKSFLASGVKLLITCDTGISAQESIEYAQSQGVDVIITDHHSLPPELPRAFAVVNPQRLPKDHPLSSLSGVGVAYELIQELCFQLQDNSFPLSLLDLVALGLIADLSHLTMDTRYLVQKGLMLMQSTPRPALQKIFTENKVQVEQVSEETISYIVAPRLNAVGRLSDANPMVEFLLSDDPVFISTTYNQIEGLNADRKIRCDQVFRGAQAQIEANPRLLERPLLFLTHPEWDGGVVGIVASRLVELYHRPAILLNTGEGNIARGSGRSIEGINIAEALQQNCSLLLSFGGHPMAAGLSARVGDLDSLQFGLISSIKQMLAVSEIQPQLSIDAYLDLNTVNLDLLVDLSRLAPFGPGNPPLHFAAKNLSIENVSSLGRTKEHLLINLLSPEGINFRFVWWQGAGLPQPEGNFDLVFQARANNYKGKVDVQFEWQEFRESELHNNTTRKSRNKTNIENLDFRNSQNPVDEISQRSKENDLLVWSEGSTSCPVPFFDRNALTTEKTLVIWSIPPSSQVLNEVLSRVKPETILWYSILPPENELDTLLTQSAALLKKQIGLNVPIISLESLAADLATTLPMATLIIRWFAFSGKITLEKIESSSAWIRAEKCSLNPNMVSKTQSDLKALHKEMVAFRSFYLRVKPVGLLISSPKS